MLVRPRLIWASGVAERFDARLEGGGVADLRKWNLCGHDRFPFPEGHAIIELGLAARLNRVIRIRGASEAGCCLLVGGERVWR